MEFEISTDDKGKPFADKVTSADGTPIPPPDPNRTRNKKKPSESVAAVVEEGKEEGTGESTKEKKGRTRNKRRGKKEAAPKVDWYSDLDEAVKTSLEGRNIKIESGRVFLSVGDSRLKVGTGGYLTLAHASGLIAEGTYSTEKAGKLTVTWERVLKLDGSTWTVSSVEAENGSLLKEIDLTDGKLRASDTFDTVWCEPSSFSQHFKFQML